MELKELVEQLDQKITEMHEKYVALHKEFDQYRGQEVGDNVEEVNRILYDIQDTFQKLYPALHFIGNRHQYACNICQNHDDFINSIKKAIENAESPIA